MFHGGDHGKLGGGAGQACPGHFGASHAVFGADAAAVGRDPGEDRVGEPLAPAAVVAVEAGHVDVQVRLGEVPPQVEAGRPRHSWHQLAQVVDKGGDAGEGDRDIQFDGDAEGVHRRGVALPVGPQPRLLGGGGRDGDVEDAGGGLDHGGELVAGIGAPGALHQQVGSVVRPGRPGPAGGTVGKGRRQALVAAHQIDAVVEHQLDGVQRTDRGPQPGEELDRAGDVGQGDQRGGPRAGQPDQSQLHPGDDPQGALTAHEQGG